MAKVPAGKTAGPPAVLRNAGHGMTVTNHKSQSSIGTNRSMGKPSGPTIQKQCLHGLRPPKIAKMEILDYKKGKTNQEPLSGVSSSSQPPQTGCIVCMRAFVALMEGCLRQRRSSCGPMGCTCSRQHFPAWSSGKKDYLCHRQIEEMAGLHLAGTQTVLLVTANAQRDWAGSKGNSCNPGLAFRAPRDATTVFHQQEGSLLMRVDLTHTMDGVSGRRYPPTAHADAATSTG